jgi:hypothetical protein
LLKIHKDVGGPKCLTKLVARDHTPGTRQQKLEGSEGQVLEADADAVPSQFARAEVGFEHTKANQR